METFISYASGIKRTSGKIKKYLDQFGFNCFLAHEDIPPQTVWPAEIIAALKRCDLFIPLLNSGFIESFFCQQETGFAYCKGIEILPVMISNAPMGMIADIQAVRFNRNEFDSSCWKIVKHVAKRKSLSKPVLDALIKWFGENGNYDIATVRAKLILNEFDFSPRQVKALRSHIKENSQIYETKEASDSIFKFIDKYSKHFNKEFIDWYDSRRASRRWMKY